MSLRKLVTLCCVIWLIMIFAHEGFPFDSSFKASPTIVSPLGIFSLPKLVQQHVSVSIEGGVAITVVEQIIRNDGLIPVEARYLFPLPQGAVVKDFKLWIDGEPISGEILSAEEAKSIYIEYLMKYRDPAILEYIGSDTFIARIFPIEPGKERKIKIEYVEILAHSFDTWQYRYPLNSGILLDFTEGLISLENSIEKLLIEVTLETEEPLRMIYSPSHNVSIERLSPTSARVVCREEHALSDKDFALYFSTGTGQTSMTFLFHRKDEDDGWFALFLVPSCEQVQPLPKDIIFVIDVSGSMEGEKLSQAKEAAIYILQRLNRKDRFGVLCFNDIVIPITQGLVEANSMRINETLRKIKTLCAEGSTNIHDALLRALKWFEPSERPKYVIFLTDGIPTTGVTEPGEIISAISATNHFGARLFIFGVGYGVNTRLLNLLAKNNRGLATYVEPYESLERSLVSFYRTISAPILTDLKLKIRGVTTYEVYPGELPDFFSGSQLSILGRYTGHGPAEIVLTARRGDKEVAIKYKVKFPIKATTSFLPKLWASRKVGYLLERIILEGEKQEFVDQIKELGMRYGIVTPYTSMLVQEPVDLDLNATTGASAVQACKSISAYQRAERTLAHHPEICEVNGRIFIFKNNMWVESNFQGEETIKIKFLSDDYLRLLEHEPKLAQILALGKHVIFSMGDKFIEIVSEE